MKNKERIVKMEQIETSGCLTGFYPFYLAEAIQEAAKKFGGVDVKCVPGEGRYEYEDSAGLINKGIVPKGQVFLQISGEAHRSDWLDPLFRSAHDLIVTSKKTGNQIPA